jgi:hypothetical protein
VEEAADVKVRKLSVVKFDHQAARITVIKSWVGSTQGLAAWASVICVQS